MTADIPRIGSDSPTPNKYPLMAYKPEAAGVTTALIPLKERTEEVKVVDPSVHKNFFSGVRSVILPIEGIRKFAIWLSKASPHSPANKAIDALAYDSSLSNAVLDLSHDYSKAGINLEVLLKDMLVKSTDYDDKVLITKILVLLEADDAFLSEFLIPVIEKRKRYENLDANHNFCCRFLSLLDETNLRKVLETIDYSLVRDIDSFAKSLMKIADPDLILEILAEVSVSLFNSESDEVRNKNKQDKIQKIALVILEVLDENEFKLPKRHLENLYKLSNDSKVHGKIANLIIKHYPQEASRLFKDELNNEYDSSDAGRRRRFHTMEHYVRSGGVYTSNTLQEFIKKEKDPFLISYACYLLAQRCEVDGRRALASVIVNDIRQGKLSIPLASITQMVEYGEPYLTILKNVLIRNYNGPNNLKTAFLSFEDAEIPKIFRDTTDGMMTFNLIPQESPELVIKLVSGVGLETFIKWAACGFGNNEKEIENFKKNSMDILDYAWEQNKEKMKEMTIAATSFGSLESRELLSSLVGMKDN